MLIDSFYMLFFNEKGNSTILRSINGDSYSSSKKPKELLETWCLMYGSSYRGSKETFCKVVNAHQKPAILVRFDAKIIYFPTTSENAPGCVYLRYDFISCYKSLPNHKTEITFLSETIIVLDIDYRIIRNQYLRCKLFVEKITYPHIYYKHEFELQCLCE